MQFETREADKKPKVESIGTIDIETYVSEEEVQTYYLRGEKRHQPKAIKKEKVLRVYAIGFSALIDGETVVKTYHLRDYGADTVMMEDFLSEILSK